MTYTQELYELLRQTNLMPQLIYSVAIAVALFLTSKLAVVYLRRSVSEFNTRLGYITLSRNLHLVLAIILITGVWLEELKTVSILLAGGVAAFIITHKELFLGISGRILLAITGMFRLGDRIRVNNVQGDVVRLGLVYTWLMEVAGPEGEEQSTGRIVALPNQWLLLHDVRNYTMLKSYCWEELAFRFPLGIDLARAIALMEDEAGCVLEETLHRAEKELPVLSDVFAVRPAPTQPRVYCALESDAGGRQHYRLSLRYLSLVRSRRNDRHTLLAALVGAFAREGLPLLGSPEADLPPTKAEAELP